MSFLKSILINYNNLLTNVSDISFQNHTNFVQFNHGYNQRWNNYVQRSKMLHILGISLHKFENVQHFFMPQPKCTEVWKCIQTSHIYRFCYTNILHFALIPTLVIMWQALPRLFKKRNHICIALKKTTKKTAFRMAIFTNVCETNIFLFVLILMPQKDDA